MNDLTKVDFHSHTFYSLLRVPFVKAKLYFQDSAISPKLLVKIAHRKKLGAIALTDHDTSKAIKPFLFYASKYPNLTPIIGQEVTKFDQNKKAWAHILTYGLKEIPWKTRFLPLPDFLDYLDANNAVYVLAHPFDLSRSAPPGGYNRKTYEINFSVLKRLRMVEIVNGLQPKRHNYLAQIIARELGIPGIAGGDNHHPKMIGRCFTYVEGSNQEEILEYLHQVKKSPHKYKLHTYGTGANPQIWAQWFFFLLTNLQYYLRYDIYRHLNPSASQKIINPVFDSLNYHKMPIISKILAIALIPYVFWTLLAGLKLWVPRIEKQTKEKELNVLKSLVDYQGINENNEVLPIEHPISKDELAMLRYI